MTNKLYYYGSATLLAICLTIYLLIPSWEQAMGLHFEPKYAAEASSILAQWSCVTDKGVLQIEAYKDGDYKIFLENKDQQQALYSKGSWTTDYDEIGNCLLYHFNSSGFHTKYAEFRRKNFTLSGDFQQDVTSERVEIFQEKFHFIVFDNYLIDAKNNQKYPLHQHYKNDFLVEKEDAIYNYTQKKIIGNDLYFNQKLIPANSLLANSKTKAQLSFVMEDNHFKAYIIEGDRKPTFYSEGTIYDNGGEVYTFVSKSINSINANYRAKSLPFCGTFYLYSMIMPIQEWSKIGTEGPIYEVWEFKNSDSNWEELNKGAYYFSRPINDLNNF